MLALLPRSATGKSSRQSQTCAHLARGRSPSRNRLDQEKGELANAALKREPNVRFTKDQVDAFNACPARSTPH